METRIVRPDSRSKEKVVPTEVRPAWHRAGIKRHQRQRMPGAAPRCGPPRPISAGTHTGHIELAVSTWRATGVRFDLEQSQVPARLVGSERRVEAPG